MTRNGLRRRWMDAGRAAACSLLILLAPAGAAGAREAPRAVVTAVGDVLLANWQNEHVYRRLARRSAWDPDAEYAYPFRNVRGELRGIVFGNLEGPLTDLPVREFADKDEPYYFGVPARFVHSLRLAGFDVVSVANNHIRDCGPDGVLDTLGVLRGAGILPVGAGPDAESARAPVFLEENGLRIAFLAYDLVPPASVWAGPGRPGAAHADEETMVADVRATSRRCDAVVVSLHWGTEIADESRMTPPSGSRVALARRLVEAGASAVIGHHSHAVERMERWRRGVILYGLGNFVFAGTQRTGHPHSAIVRLTLGGGALPRVHVLPVLISPDRARWSPRLMTGPERSEFLARLGLDSSGRLP